MMDVNAHRQQWIVKLQALEIDIYDMVLRKRLQILCIGDNSELQTDEEITWLLEKLSNLQAAGKIIQSLGYKGGRHQLL